MEIIEINRKNLGDYWGYHYAVKLQLDRDVGYKCPIKSLDTYLARSLTKMSKRVVEEQLKLPMIPKLTPRQQWELEKKTFLEEFKYWQALDRQLGDCGRENKSDSPPNPPFPSDALILEEGWGVYDEFDELLKLTSGMTEEEWQHKDDDWIDSANLVVSRSNDN